MTTAKTWKGEWFFPGKTEGYKGVLSFDPVDGCRLELFGVYESGMGSGTIALLTGKTTDGLVTLLDTRYKSGNFSNQTKTGYALYLPSVILEGWAFNDVSELSFTSVSFTVANLQEWMAVNAIEVHSGEKQMMEYEKQPDIVFECYPGCEGKIEFGFTGNYPQYPYKIYIEQYCKVVLTYPTEKPFREITQDMTRFAGLITLCTYEHSFTTSIDFYNEKIIDKSVLETLKIERPQAITYIYKNAFYKPDAPKSNIHHWLIDAARIREHFSGIVTNWFALHKELEMFVQLILRAFVDKYNWSTDKFLDAARAIEAFHRMNYNNRIFTKAEIKLVRSKVDTLEMAEKYKDMLHEKLNYAHEPTLKHRLDEMIAVYAFPYFDERVTDRDAFGKAIRKWRNYYTHLTKKEGEPAPDIKELYDLTENINLLLFAAIFKKLGIPVEAFNDSIRVVVY